MDITLPLLGHLNSQFPKDSPLRPKYIVKITAARLAQLLIYERKGKKKSDPFKISSSSLIKIDKEIQRGVDAQGFHLQQPTKVLDIAHTLLGKSDVGAPRVYLGALIWNVRSGEFSRSKRETEGRPAEWDLIIDTQDIFLTDSAHRHLGIVEAYRIYTSNPTEYPLFSPKFEFSVEVFNLDRIAEKELFNELNSKQKKITATKSKEMDVSSPIGALKDAIRQYDDESARLFDNNIEVSSNRNDQHTLMTMSVFVSSIDEMFTQEEIREARKDDELRGELAAYYCNFSYRLHDRLVVKCDINGDGVDEDVHPFSNLYTEIIKKAEDAWDRASPLLSDQKLEAAREGARERNRQLRRKDIANHNGTIKALYRLGGVIRLFKNWTMVIDLLQTELNLGLEGRFFQVTNKDLFSKASESDIPIASLNKDGTINLQVQDKNITKLYRYLRTKLHLDNLPVIVIRSGDEHFVLGGGATTYRWQLSSAEKSIRTIEVRFLAVVPPLEENVRLGVVPSIEWKGGTIRASKKLVPNVLRRDESFSHSHYEEITRWSAFFEVELPKASGLSGQFELKVEVTFPDFNGVNETYEVEVAASVP